MTNIALSAVLTLICHCWLVIPQPHIPHRRHGYVMFAKISLSQGLPVTDWELCSLLLLTAMRTETTFIRSMRSILYPGIWLATTASHIERWIYKSKGLIGVQVSSPLFTQIPTHQSWLNETRMSTWLNLQNRQKDMMVSHWKTLQLTHKALLIWLLCCSGMMPDTLPV